MMIINRLKMPISMARSIEDSNASIIKHQADIDYIAMMTDVDIPTEEEVENNVRED